jgi:membrane-bound lytic murein transglycosylase B
MAIAALAAAGGCATATSTAQVPEEAPPSVAAYAPADAPESLESRLVASKGWSHLVERLVETGLPRAAAEQAFADPRMPAFDGLFFRVEPREPRSMYREVLQGRSVSDARDCRAEHSAAFEAAERSYGVSADVVAAILHVETRCGRNTGGSTVLHGLARLTMANEPANVEANVDRTAVTDGVLDEELAARVRARAAKLEEMFLPEVRATFEVARAEGVDPLSLTGSPSGAFGVPQFLPTSYLKHGADGNGDGTVDLYDLDDAAASAARFLAAFGWSSALGHAERRQVIWNYNRSDAYIDAVLDLADRIAPPAGRAVSAGTDEGSVATGEAGN